MSICFCGMCIPYTAIWPLLLLIVQPVWAWVSKIMGLGSKTAGKKIDSDVVSADNVSKGKSETCDCCSPKSIPASPFKLDSSLKFADLIADKEKTTVIARFTAEWCKPCKAIEPKFNAVAEANGAKAHFVAIDIDEFDTLAEEYNVYTIPKYIAFRNGERVADIDVKGLEDYVQTKL